MTGRVLLLCCDAGIAWGGAKGAAVHLGELARALVGEGAEVLVAVAHREEARPSPGVTVEVLPGPGRRARLAERLAAERARVEWLTERLSTWAPGVVYERISLHTTAGATTTAAAGVPHIVELNAPLPEEAARYRSLEEPGLAHELERRVLAGADAVLAVSPPLAAYARHRGARRVMVCPNAVDPARFPVAADAAAEPVLAVFAGSLRPWHGAGTLADAWDRLGDQAPALRVVGDGDGRHRLEAAGATVTGMVEPARVPSLLLDAQIGMAPYPADAPDYFSPLKVFEYLAAGLAVVAADLPGIADTVGEAVVLVPPGDPGRLAAAVAGLAADPQGRARLGRAGRELALSEHTWAHRAGAVLDLVKELGAGRLVNR